MLNQFSRTQLLLGQDGMERLFRARVAVFGIGGVGGYTVEALARSGVGTLDLIDDDRVCLTNVNRQIFATRKTVGQYKVDVAEARIKEIIRTPLFIPTRPFTRRRRRINLTLPSMTTLWMPSTPLSSVRSWVLYWEKRRPSCIPSARSG